MRGGAAFELFRFEPDLPVPVLQALTAKPQGVASTLARHALRRWDAGESPRADAVDGDGGMSDGDV